MTDSLKAEGVVDLAASKLAERAAYWSVRLGSHAEAVRVVVAALFRHPWIVYKLIPIVQAGDLLDTDAPADGSEPWPQLDDEPEAPAAAGSVTALAWLGGLSSQASTSKSGQAEV